MYDTLAEHIIVLSGLVLIVLPMLIMALRQDQ